MARPLSVHVLPISRAAAQRGSSGRSAQTRLIAGVVALALERN
jgi:hypothetical protein